MAKVRLNKALAEAGITSRRGGDRLILEGRVALNGAVVLEPGTLADPALDRITVDGRPLPSAETKRYFVLHKPRGYVTTVHDPQGRATVTDLVPGPGRLYPIGRLDADVEGVLLLTNDGPLTHRLLHPRYAIERVYDALVRGGVTEADLPRWRAGAVLEDGPARPTSVVLLDTGKDGTRVRLTFTEGRKHEVKRYCDALGHPVIALRRVAFGPIHLGDLPPGASRELTRAEVQALRAVAEIGADRAREARRSRSDH